MPRVIRQGGGGGPPGIPDKGIIVWTTKLADLPAGFLICDGTNGTPNLTGHYAAGAGPSNAHDTVVGAQTQEVSGTASTAGDHTISAQRGGGGNGNPQWAWSVIAAKGNHSHASVEGDVETDPAARQYYFIMANGNQPVPDGARFWFNGPAAPTDFAEETNLRGRFVKHSPNDDDVGNEIGVDPQTVTVTGNTGGDHPRHLNSPPYNNDPTPDPAKQSTRGAHSGGGTIGITIDEPPPYHVLLAIRATVQAAALANEMVIFFYNTPAAIPAGWVECTAANSGQGAPNLEGRLLVGLDGSEEDFDTIGKQGGDTDRSCSGTLSHSGTHNHDGGGSQSQPGYHPNNAWSHSHPWTTTATNGAGYPLSRYLRAIIFKGA